MQLTIFFTPADVKAIDAPTHAVYIVIDLIRATTTMTVMLDHGAARIYAANSLEQAREAARKVPGRLLCGERNVKTPADFDFGNSPTQFAHAAIAGRELILTTSNGTRAFFACPPDSIRLGGCFYNADAVVTQALALAQQDGRDLAIVCAAEYNYFTLDDTVCAGYLAQELLRRNPAIEVRDSVHAAIALHERFAPPRLIEYNHSAQLLYEADLQRDLDYCFKVSASSSIPAVVGYEEETDLLVIERYHNIHGDRKGSPLL